VKAKELCYFDNAATSFPKPAAVVRESMRCMREYCGNPGRGSHRLSLLASEKLYEARELCALLFGAQSSENVVFTLNATHALNTAIFGLCPEGAHVLISDLEHNSTLRPLEYLKRYKGVSYSVFSTSGDILANVEKIIKENTAMLVCTHTSNICNKVLPLPKIGRLLHEKGIIFVVDASQSAGVHRIDMQASRISALCFPGHKGLLGPQGVGGAVFSDGILPRPLIYGGSGSESRLLLMPDKLPDRLEAGTMATPAIAGLCEGIKYVLQRGEENIFEKECSVMDTVRKRFSGDERIETYSKGRGGIWLFNIKGQSSQKTAQRLDDLGVCVRAGLHCAPLAHKTLETPESGAVRVSAGALTTASDGERFCVALEKVLRFV